MDSEEEIVAGSDENGSIGSLIGRVDRHDKLIGGHDLPLVGMVLLLDHIS